MSVELMNICAKYPLGMKRIYDTGEIDYNSTFFDEVYDHFVNSGEMPIGIAKARTGDPVVWISERISETFNIYS